MREIPGYDRMMTEGQRHRCGCGAIWTDADGGPCHDLCKGCGEMFPVEKLSIDLFCKTCEED